MSIKIRKAVPADAKAIAEIWNQGIRDRAATFQTVLKTKEGTRLWLKHHDRHHPVLVVEAEKKGKMQSSQVVAWTAISPYQPNRFYDGVGEVSLYVSKDFRHKGLGKKLLNALIRKAERLGYWKLLALVFASNTPSRGLCRKCGFREVGIHEKHGKLEGKWLDTVILERLIPKNQV